MPNAAQVATYDFIRSEIARLRGPESYVPLPVDQVSPLTDCGEDALFRVNGASVFVKKSGKVTDAGLPGCPTYASGLLPVRLLPAIAADLLSRGSPHKPFLHNHSHTVESFIAYLQHGTVLDTRSGRTAQRKQKTTCVTLTNGDPHKFVLQFAESDISRLVSRRLANVEQDKAFQAGNNIANGSYSRGNLEAIVEWKMDGVYLPRVMAYLAQNTDVEIERALRSAVGAYNERAAIEALDTLHGVGVPVASAVLTTISPETYTIIDIYALRSLGVSHAPTNRVDYYLAYLKKCREMAQQFKISLRTLDHALWQWGYEH